MPDTAIVLAGGLGTRLRAALPDRPKALAPVLGRPFLDYVLGYLSDQGIHQVILSTGYLAQQVQDFAGHGERWALQVTYSQEKTPLGTGGALRLASEGLATGPFFALNGDTLFMIDLQALWQTHQTQKALATIALRAIDPQEANAERAARGCVRLLSNGKIVAFEEKDFDEKTFDERRSEERALTAGKALESIHPALSSPGAALINAGIYVLEKQALDSLLVGEKASLERQIFPRLAAQNRLSGHVQQGYFIDIGTPESLAKFEKDVAAGLANLE